ncbi:MAG TPA: enolase C-terminal domain-like protein, partial [Acidimicrobiia bacterium]|nr:enolase C-terminal domain-like protein [Acidimicrobiia bacterium]
MKIEAVELRQVALTLVEPFRTAKGTHDSVEKLLVRVVTPDAEGWGECPVGLGPGSLDSVDEAWDALLEPEPSSALPPPAAGALEAARLDAELRAAGESLAARLGATRTAVDAGVVVGIAPSISALIDEVERRVSEGYRRVKLTIEPGWDIEPVAAARDRFGADLALQVDGNGAYGAADGEHLAELDRFG